MCGLGKNYLWLARLTREQIRFAVYDAIAKPDATTSGGRPRVERAAPLVVKMLAVRETHSDDSYHFHVAVKLSSNQRFSAAKRTLLIRYGLPSHWSTSHSQWWSAVRYCTHTTAKKATRVK